jgi:UDP-glucose 4-epimerase
MNVLITGCRGFVGGSVGRFAAQVGHTVLGIGLSSQPDDDWPGGYRQADVCNDDLTAIVQQFEPDIVLHAAGTASVSASIELPLADLRSALMTWANVLESVRKSRHCPLVLFPSSAAVYGNPVLLPVPERAEIAPISPYGFHKAACELLAREYADCFGLNIVVGRLFSVYGPRQRRLLLWELYRQAAAGGPEIVLRGTGDESRDYLHIDDIAAMLLHLASLELPGLTVINIASGEETNIRDLARLIARAVDVDCPITALGARQPGDPSRWRADISMLESLGPPRPQSLADGIAACVRAWQ